MPVSDLHYRVAAVALAAAAEHGFGLGGGNALLAHGVITRPTQDVDLFDKSRVYRARISEALAVAAAVVPAAPRTGARLRIT